MSSMPSKYQTTEFKAKFVWIVIIAPVQSEAAPSLCHFYLKLFQLFADEAYIWDCRYPTYYNCGRVSLRIDRTTTAVADLI